MSVRKAILRAISKSKQPTIAQDFDATIGKAWRAGRGRRRGVAILAGGGGLLAAAGGAINAVDSDLQKKKKQRDAEDAIERHNRGRKK